jgi:hypothetical protein
MRGGVRQNFGMAGLHRDPDRDSLPFTTPLMSKGPA